VAARRYGGARVAKLMAIYDQTPAHSFLGMLDPKNGLAPGDPDPHGRAHHRERRRGARAVAPGARLAGVGRYPKTLRKRIASFEAQSELAASTDFPPEA
jgi:hypothetical protein